MKASDLKEVQRLLQTRNELLALQHMALRGVSPTRKDLPLTWKVGAHYAQGTKHELCEWLETLDLEGAVMAIIRQEIQRKIKQTEVMIAELGVELDDEVQG